MNNIGSGNYALANSDTGQAAGELEARRGNGDSVGRQLNFNSIVDNFASGSNKYYAPEVVYAFSRITADCGSNTAGMDTSLRGATRMGMRKRVQSSVDGELDGGVGLLGVQYWECCQKMVEVRK